MIGTERGGEVNERAVIGGNRAPFDFFEFFDMVVNTMGMTSAEKLMQIIIARRSHAVGGRSVSPARAELARQASCSEATLKRSYRLLETFFDVNKRSGKTTEYTPRAVVTQADVELAIKGMSPVKGAHHEPPTPTLGEPGAHGDPAHGEPGAHGARVMVSRGAPSEVHGEPGQKLISANVPPHPPKDNIYINNPPVVPRGRSKRDPFELNGTITSIHRDCWFDEHGRLQVANGFQAELVKIVGDPNRLRVELDSAMRFVGPNTPPTVLKSKVLGQVQHQMAEKTDRDQRYANAVKRNSESGPPREGEFDGKFYIDGKEKPEFIYRRHIEAKRKALGHA